MTDPDSLPSLPPAYVADPSAGVPRGVAARPLLVEEAIGRPVAAFTRALRLSCRAAGEPARPALANDAVAAHVAARAWAEEAVRRASCA